jgi:hypothetical protein
MSSTNTYTPTRPASDDGLSAVLAFIRKLASERYFGNVQFSFQSGHVVNIRQEQSMKLNDLSNLVASSKGNSDVRNSQ